MAKRTKISESTKQIVLLEAGYKCANPICRHVLTLELHHIVWVKDEGGDKPENGLKGTDIHDAWSKTLKDTDAFVGTNPEDLLKPVSDMRDTRSVLHYLKNRYWK